MENLFITIVCIALILLATVSYASSSLGSADLISSSFKEMVEKAGEISRTKITATGATTADGNEVEVTLLNDGSTSLRNYSRWDVIVRYADGDTEYIPYSAAGAHGKWSNIGTFLLSGSPDIYEPGILNPGETLKINVRLPSAATENTTNLAIISTDGGIKTQKSFGW